jgi:hypothetical protein
MALTIQGKLQHIHSALMWARFPYHSVSVIHRWQDVGLHVYIMESQRERLEENRQLRSEMKAFGFSWSFVREFQ